MSLLQLQALGVRVLVLDFDGVMAAHGEALPHADCVAWLKTAIDTWPLARIAILSNKPLAIRQAYFQTHFPTLLFITQVAKKPYPDGLQRVAHVTDTPIEHVGLVDDRWLTGMLASALAGAQGIYVQTPYRDLKKRCISESFFALLRWGERVWLKLG